MKTPFEPYMGHIKRGFIMGRCIIIKLMAKLQYVELRYKFVTKHFFLSLLPDFIKDIQGYTLLTKLIIFSLAAHLSRKIKDSTRPISQTHRSISTKDYISVSKSKDKYHQYSVRARAVYPLFIACFKLRRLT